MINDYKEQYFYQRGQQKSFFANQRSFRIVAIETRGANSKIMSKRSHEQLIYAFQMSESVDQADV